MANPKPPGHLRPATKRWFSTVLDDYDLDPHHVRLLTLAGEAWDRGQAAREIVDRDGMTFVDRFAQPKARPEVSIELNSRTSFARLLRELSLDIDTPSDAPRPPRTADYGNRR